MHEKNKSSKRLTTDSGLSKYFVGPEVALVQLECVINVYQDTSSYPIRQMTIQMNLNGRLGKAAVK